MFLMQNFCEETLATHKNKIQTLRRLEMKKFLFAVIALLLIAGTAWAADVTISGDIQTVFAYNNDTSPKYLLGFYRIDTFLDMEAVENVSGRIDLRPDLVGNGTLLLNEAYFVVKDLLVEKLSAKVGLLTTSFVSYNKNLMLYPKTYDLRHRAGAIELAYNWDMAKIEAALCNSGTGLSAGTEGAKSATVRISSDKLLAGLFVGLGYKSIASTGLRTGSLSVTGQYKFEQLILDAEYVGQMTGDIKPSDWFVSLGYNVTDDLLASIRYEGLKESGIESILSGGIKYMYKPNLAGIIEVENSKITGGTSSTTFCLGAIYTY